MLADASVYGLRRVPVLAACLLLATACAARKQAGDGAPAAPAPPVAAQPATAPPSAPAEANAATDAKPGAAASNASAAPLAAGPPADHVKAKDGALHKRGYKKPLGDCSSCHGQDLKGEGRAPSCYSCHGRKWH